MRTNKEEQLRLYEQGKKRCSVCQCIFTLDNFHKNHRTRDGFYCACKTCKNNRNTERRKIPQVQQARKEKAEAWKKNNIERIRNYGKTRRDKIKKLKARKYGIKKGYIYIFKWEDFVKIGISVNPIKRIKALTTGLPTEGKLIHLIKTNNMRDAEKTIHDKFSYARKRGEWFSLTESDLEYLQSLTYIDTNLITP